MDPTELKSLPRSERVEKVFNFSPTDYQATLLDHHEEQDKTQAAPKKGRQVGASLVGSALAADYAITNADSVVLITAPMQDPADELFEKFTQHFKNSDLTLEQLGVVEDNKTEWRFANGTRVISKTLGQGDLSQRGRNPSFVIVDEAAYATDYHLSEVIEPFFITHKEYEFYLFSTPLGKSGYFYDAVEGQNSDAWYSPHWPTEISPFADKDYLERKKQERDSQSFAQEYLGEFVSSEDALIPHELVQPILEDTDLSGQKWLGVDIARGGKDNTVYTEIDEHGAVNVVDHEESSTIDGIRGRIRDLHRKRNYEQIVVEENAISGGVIDFGGDMGNVISPFTSSTKSKHQLYKRLKKDIESQDLSLPNHRKLIDQLTSLEFDFTQHGYMKVSHPKGGHDDFPDSLAFANWGRTGAGGGQVVERKARVSVSHNNL
jgi:hypothetical protein